MSDYQRIAKAISFIVEHTDRQPSLEEIAAHLRLSPFHFQRLFSRWAGVTPKRYLQTITLERAKNLLAESRSVLDVSESLGLSSGSRLYDHFVHLEAVTPGEFKKRGAGLEIVHATHDTPFGKAFIATTARGICKLAFLDYLDIEDVMSELTAAWPLAMFRADESNTQAIINRIFERKRSVDKPLSLYVSGTNFQVSVWKALLKIPPGQLSTYSGVASSVGRPKAVRAVGTAIGANPVAFLIPCHRVIRQTGELGGYHWGETRMHAIHAWESARKE
jgi:AraC family transcriptional regulator of adaptative response/methylated-DNA-[protein]-cysteine methyltransferase